MHMPIIVIGTYHIFCILLKFIRNKFCVRNFISCLLSKHGIINNICLDNWSRSSIYKKYRGLFIIRARNVWIGPTNKFLAFNGLRHRRQRRHLLSPCNIRRGITLSIIFTINKPSNLMIHRRSNSRSCKRDNLSSSTIRRNRKLRLMISYRRRRISNLNICFWDLSLIGWNACRLNRESLTINRQHSIRVKISTR